MKTFTITKEQISGLYNNANVPWYTIRDNFKDWFPDAFKEELEIEKWYKSQLGSIVYLSKDDTKSFYRHYGFDTFGKWFEEDILNKGCAFVSGLKPATKEEVESALIKEAKKRGFKNRVRINNKSLGYYYNDVFNSGNCFDYVDNVLTIGLSCIIIFKDGKWAEVIKTETRFTNPNNYESALEDLQFVGENTRKEMSKVFRKLAETLDKE